MFQFHVIRARQCITLALCGLLCATAWAHVVFDPPQAVANSNYKAHLRVGHGCNGEATHALIAYLPAEMQGAKPQAKAGWRVTTQKTRLATPYESHGKTVVEDVSEIRWEATQPEHDLPDDQFDEFTFMAKLTGQPGPVWVRVLQVCATQRNDWAQVPAPAQDKTPGQRARTLKYPAAVLEVLPPANTTPHHHH